MTTPEPEGVSGATMPLSSHLRELRTRLMWTFIVVGIGAIGAFAIGNRLVEVLLIPFPDYIEVVQIDILEGIRVPYEDCAAGRNCRGFPDDPLPGGDVRPARPLAERKRPSFTSRFPSRAACSSAAFYLRSSCRYR